eukprot:254758_1
MNSPTTIDINVRSFCISIQIFPTKYDFAGSFKSLDIASKFIIESCIQLQVRISEHVSRYKLRHLMNISPPSGHNNLLFSRIKTSPITFNIIVPLLSQITLD